MKRLLIYFTFLFASMTYGLYHFLNIEYNIESRTLATTVEVTTTNQNDPNKGDGTIDIKAFYSKSSAAPINPVANIYKNSDSSIVKSVPIMKKTNNEKYNIYKNDTLYMPVGEYKVGIDSDKSTEVILKPIYSIREANGIEAPSFFGIPEISNERESKWDNENSRWSDADIGILVKFNNIPDRTTITGGKFHLFDAKGNITYHKWDNVNDINASVIIKNVDHSEYQSYFELEYKNSSGIEKTAFSNSSNWKVTGSDDDSESVKPVVEEIVISNPIPNNYMDLNNNSGSMDLKVGITHRDLNINNVKFRLTHATDESFIKEIYGTKKTITPDKDLYSAKVEGLPNGNYSILASVIYPGDIEYEDKNYSLVDSKTPKIKTNTIDTLIADSYDSIDTGSINTIIDIEEYIIGNPYTDNNLKFYLKDSSNIRKPIAKTKIGVTLTNDYLVENKYKLFINDLSVGTYSIELDFTGISDSTPTTIKVSSGIEIKQIKKSTPLIVDHNFESTNSTFYDSSIDLNPNGKIKTSLMVDENENSEFDVNYELKDSNGTIVESDNIGFKKGDKLNTKEISSTLVEDNYKLKLSINTETIGNYFIPIEMDDRRNPTIINDDGIISTDSSFQLDDGSINFIKILYEDLDKNIKSIKYELKSGNTVLGSISGLQDTNNKNLWSANTSNVEGFSNLKPQIYNVASIITLETGSSIILNSNILINEKPNPEDLSNLDILWIALGILGGLLIIGAGAGYYFVKIKI